VADFAGQRFGRADACCVLGPIDEEVARGAVDCVDGDGATTLALEDECSFFTQAQDTEDFSPSRDLKGGLVTGVLHVDVVTWPKDAETGDISSTADAGVPELIAVLSCAEVGTCNDSVALHEGGASKELIGGCVFSSSLDVKEGPG